MRKLPEQTVHYGTALLLFASAFISAWLSGDALTPHTFVWGTLLGAMVFLARWQPRRRHALRAAVVFAYLFPILAYLESAEKGWLGVLERSLAITALLVVMVMLFEENPDKQSS